VLERVQKHADGGRELAGILRQPRVTTQLLLARLPRRPGEQVVVISRSNSSSASSTALASSERTVATSVASRRGSG
jgi:hypothetical protein